MTKKRLETSDSALIWRNLPPDALQVILQQLGEISVSPKLLPSHMSSIKRQETAFHWSKIRLTSRSFRDSIDSAAVDVLRQSTCTCGDVLASKHFTSHAVKSLHRLSNFSFVSFSFMRARVCVLCKKTYTGGIHPSGVYAHTDCVKRAPFATYYIMNT